MSDIENSLSDIEAQLQEVEAALMATDPLTLEQAARRLREAVIACSQLMEDAGASASWPESMARRMQALATRLGLLREQLARVQALTERQTAALLPPVQDVTYDMTGSPAPAANKARIYRAPG
jgi:hypothetical protein